MQFAKDPDGQIHAAWHATGDAYTCCHCDTPVVLRVGAVREPHFAHLSGTADCPGRRHTSNGTGDVTRPYMNVGQLDFTELGLALPEPIEPVEPPTTVTPTAPAAATPVDLPPSDETPPLAVELARPVTPDRAPETCSTAPSASPTSVKAQRRERRVRQRLLVSLRRWWRRRR